MSLTTFLNWLLGRPCIFCEIVLGKRSDQIIYQDKDMVAFHDRDPAAETHILLVTREHIPSVKTLQNHHLELLLRIQSKAHQLLQEYGHDPEDPSQCRLGYHRPPFNTVDHLHLHVLGGEFKSAYRSSKYEQGKKWYMDLEDLLKQLQTTSSTIDSKA